MFAQRSADGAEDVLRHIDIAVLVFRALPYVIAVIVHRTEKDHGAFLDVVRDAVYDVLRLSAGEVSDLAEGMTVRLVYLESDRISERMQPVVRLPDTDRHNSS